MESTEYAVTLTPYMMACGGVIMGVIQIVKDAPIVNRIKSWLPFAPMVLAVIWAFADGWPKPILTGIVLGLNLTGVYKVVNAPVAAITGNKINLTPEEVKELRDIVVEMIEKKNNGGDKPTVTP